MLETIEKMVAWTAKPLSAIPNAGLPTAVEGRNIYLCSPEYMAQYARRLLQAGVRIVGGCCGTTPEHIKAIRKEARSLQPARHTPNAAAATEAAAQTGRCRKFPWRRRAVWGRNSLRASLWPSWKFCPREASTHRRRSKAPGFARLRVSMHQCSGRPPRERAIERADHVSANPATRRDRSRASLLLPRPQHAGHPERASGRACGRNSQSHLHHGRSAAHGHLS